MDRRPEAERGAARKRAREEEAAEEDGEAWRRPPGVFRFPWQKCRGGLGVVVAGGWELRDVFFRSLVDGGAAAIGVPGDRLVPPPPPPSRQLRALFEDVDAWLAAAADGEVDPVWRSALERGHAWHPVRERRPIGGVTLTCRVGDGGGQLDADDQENGVKSI